MIALGNYKIILFWKKRLFVELYVKPDHTCIVASTFQTIMPYSFFIVYQRSISYVLKVLTSSFCKRNPVFICQIVSTNKPGFVICCFTDFDPFFSIPYLNVLTLQNWPDVFGVLKTMCHTLTVELTYGTIIFSIFVI